MANTFQNLSFEIVGFESGDAAGWAQNELATAEELAGYGPSSLSVRRRPEEDFEDGWDNDDFVLVLGLTEDAFYDLAISPERPEDFEEGWLNNESFTFVLSGLDIATYDSTPQDFEDFEEEWLNNEAFEFQLGATASAAFGGPGGAEDFEQSWDVDNFIIDFALAPAHSPGYDFNDLDPDTITDAQDFLALGFVPGVGIEVLDSLSNDGVFAPLASVSSSTLTLDIGDAVTAEINSTAATIQQAAVAFYGPVRNENFEASWTLMVTF